MVIWVLQTSLSQTKRFGLVLYPQKFIRKAKTIIAGARALHMCAHADACMHPFPAHWLCKTCPREGTLQVDAALGRPCPRSAGFIQKQWPWAWYNKLRHRPLPRFLSPGSWCPVSLESLVGFYYSASVPSSSSYSARLSPFQRSMWLAWL